MEPVKVGLLGMGTVGGGTVNVLSRNAKEITRRAGRGIQISHAATRDINKARICDTTGITLTTQPQDVVNDPEVQIVIELIGGDTLAREVMEEYFSNRPPVQEARRAGVME